MNGVSNASGRPYRRGLTAMYDTIVMVTEHLSPSDWPLIQEQMQARYGVNAATGEVDYTHYTATLVVPLTACPVRLTVRTSKWIKEPGQKAPRKVDGLRSLRVECSLHRALVGHNAYGGPPALAPAVSWLLMQLSDILQLSLPGLAAWSLRRLDIAESYNLGSEDNVLAWIHAKRLLRHPRRTVHHWPQGFVADGSTTCLRCYAKANQMRTEDLPRAMSMCMSPAEVWEVMDRAAPILRAEMEVKGQVWDKTPLTVDQVDDEDLHERFAREWSDWLRPLEGDTVHTAIEVESRLRESQGKDWRNLYAIWCQLAIRGEVWYRAQVHPVTWRKSRAALEQAGVGWLHTDVLSLSGPSELADFVPNLTDRRRLTEPHPRVAALA